MCGHFDEELVEHLIACRHDDARLWLIELQDSVNSEDFVKILVTLWSIWWARRKAIHEENFQSPLSTFSFITSYLADLAEATRKKQGCVHAHQDGPKWRAPTLGFVKIYVDVVVGRHEDGGSFAAVCRDGTCNFLGASAVSV